MSDSDELLELASALADGTEIDWDRAQRTTQDRENDQILEALQDLAHIDAAHRSHREVDQQLDTWGHLEIIEKVGQGGFGEVYRARDPQLDREVALKLLHPSARIRGVVGEAVIREARLMARVKHPNVATVYGADRRDGQVGLWMEFLDGQTLADVVKQQGPLAAREAVLIVMDLCQALAAVHAQGIVHRDVKAQNVMRERGGRLVLMDFGIGRDLQDSNPKQNDLSGTPLYLAPEVLEGDSATEKSDIYSLGVLLYYLVTGEFPVQGSNLAELQAAHRQGNVRRLRDLRADLPASFVHMVECSLAKDPKLRFASAGEFEKALAELLYDSGPADKVSGAFIPDHKQPRQLPRRLVFTATLSLIALAAYLLWPAPPETSIQALVAGWKNLSDDPRFDGVEVLRQALTDAAEEHPEQLDLLSPKQVASTFPLMRRDPVTRPFAPELASEIAQRNGAALFLNGQVRRLDSGFEIELAAYEAEAWREWVTIHQNAASADQIRSSLLDAARRLVKRIAASEIEPSERLPQVTTSSLEALRRYAQAQTQHNNGQLDQALSSLKVALSGDSDFAMAYRQKAMCLSGLGQFSEALEAARQAFRRLGPTTNTEKFQIKGTYFIDRAQYLEAIDSFEAYLQKAPEDTTALRQLAMLYAEIGKLDTGLEWAHQAWQTNPHHVLNRGIWILQLAEDGQAQKALSEFGLASKELSEENDGNLHYLYWGKGLAHLVLGETDEAKAAFSELTQGENMAQFGQLFYSQTLIREGDLDTAKERLRAGIANDQISESHFAAAHRHHWLALIHIEQGNHPEAHRHLKYFFSLVGWPANLRHLRNAALAYIEIGAYEPARKLLGAIERLDDSYPSLFSRSMKNQVAAELALTAGNTLTARDLLQLAYRGDPSVLFSIAKLHEHSEEWPQAVQTYEEYLELTGRILRHDWAGRLRQAKERLANCRKQLQVAV